MMRASCDGSVDSTNLTMIMAFNPWRRVQRTMRKITIQFFYSEKVLKGNISILTLTLTRGSGPEQFVTHRSKQHS
jgi:hypothetical protein